ncbi:hypothetical protein SF06_14330 [Pseudomonas flexibilis]|nr:hypothetical protein SF06_14330 [Pseudomonas flexibilis]
MRHGLSFGKSLKRKAGSWKRKRSPCSRLSTSSFRRLFSRVDQPTR